MRTYRSLGVFAGLLLAAPLALASPPTAKPFDISTQESFRAQAAQVRTDLDPGGMYGFLSTSDRAQVEQQVATMDALFSRYGSVQAMDGAERVELYNAQESANWILTRGREGNIRCAWSQPTGSHIRRTQCWYIGA